MNTPLKIITTVALQAVVEKLAPAFNAATGRNIVMVFAPPPATVELVRKGEQADVIVATPDGIDALIDEGLVTEGSGRAVCRMQMGLAVGLNEPKPAIATPEQFKAALLNAKSIIHADPSSGSPSAAHFLSVIRHLGIADEIRAKATMRSGVVAHAVADGECAMAVQQLAELKLVPGVHVLGPFPDALQNYLTLTAAVHAASQAQADATILIHMLSAPRAKPIIEQAGLLTA